MSKVDAILSSVENVITSVGELADSLKNLTDVLVNMEDVKTTKKIETKKPTEKAEKNYTLEEVRGILAKKSQQGFTSQVKELISKFGCNRLSKIEPSKYSQVVNEAEGIGNE